MTCIHPIGNALLVDGRELTTLGHETGGACYTAGSDAVPPRHNTGIGIEIRVAAVAGIEVTGTTITRDQLFDLGVFGAVVQDGDLCRIQTTPVVSYGEHIFSGCEIGKQAGGLKRTVIQFVAHGVAGRIEYRNGTIVAGTDGGGGRKNNIKLDPGAGIGRGIAGAGSDHQHEQ